MKVYIVSADTWVGGYGSNISLFGIFSDKNKAEDRKRSLEERYGYYTCIEEVTLDEICEIYLGGYVE